MAMRIGIDATSVLDEQSGVEMHVLTVTEALARLGSDDEIVAFVRRQAPVGWTDIDPRFRVRCLPTDSQAVATQALLPLAARTEAVDVLYCPAKPPPAAAAMPVLNAIHDAVPWTRPASMGRGAARWYRTFDTLSIRRRGHVATVSEASADEIQRHLSVKSDRVHVLGNALAPWLERAMLEQAASLEAPARPAIAGSGPYVLSLCRMEPRKNVGSLLDAWPQIQAACPGARLLLAGKVGWGVETEIERARAVPGVELTGWVDNADLHGLYANASAFVTASVEEGFGLPILEAMALGAPVVASDIPAHAEVGADAIARFPLGDSQQLARTIIDLLTSPDKSQRLRCRGRHRALCFSSVGVAERLHRALVLTAGR
jgi:glycosyltransferase involved in cell wall biosynthesis